MNIIAFGPWNVCDLDNPGGTINTTHLLYEKIHAFAKRIFDNTPGPFQAGLGGFNPEIPSTQCVEDITIPESVTGIEYVNEGNCSNRYLRIIGGEGGLEYEWWYFSILLPFPIKIYSNTNIILPVNPCGGEGVYYLQIVTKNGCGTNTSAWFPVTIPNDCPCEEERKSWNINNATFPDILNEYRSSNNPINYNNGGYLQITLDQPSSADWYLYDMKGALIDRASIYLLNGINSYKLSDIINIPIAQGMYILQIVTPKQMWSEKIFITNKSR